METAGSAGSFAGVVSRTVYKQTKIRLAEVFMAKITFMGAGSTVFAKNVLGDCLSTDTLAESEICLYDIDQARLEESKSMLDAINKNVNQKRAVIKSYLGTDQRKEALRDADFVVNAIQVGGYDPCTIIDFEIPKK